MAAWNSAGGAIAGKVRWGLAGAVAQAALLLAACGGSGDGSGGQVPGAAGSAELPRLAGAPSGADATGKQSIYASRYR